MNDKFDLERCINGEPVETESGTAMHFLLFDADLKHPLAMRCGSAIYQYNTDGKRDYHSPLRMKSTIRKVDLSKLPVDTLVETEQGLRYFADYKSGLMVFPHGRNSHTAMDTYCYARLLRISPNQPWTVWQGGGCPIPDGLEFEVVTRGGAVLLIDRGCEQVLWSYAQNGLHSMSEIIAYRLTGNVLDGWEL